MDTENEKPDPEYIRKFNQGYILAKYMPGLSERISKSKSQTPNLQAMQDGRKQFLSEEAISKAPSWLKPDPQKLNKNLLGKTKGRQIDPER
ncbi:hypothetical protein DYBT9275_05126 [Dyadobacter sp. CECT 9275]|uniref:Uncharacterized protein n=1 Tax=Dyadobacter helix TaxID=2822344 RepID=A0A916JHV4_9BACT|nr:hypothetical protein [Dyadobacter sp. CECT 9275]CAG5012193.1 hypothetical protein DYBT9275_05126 [Dyadobacter sp. CECT 9275]